MADGISGISGVAEDCFGTVNLRPVSSPSVDVSEIERSVLKKAILQIPPEQGLKTCSRCLQKNERRKEKCFYCGETLFD